MKKFAKIASLIALCLTLVITAVSCGASSPESDSGDCGSGLTWSYDSETQALNISGNGQMTDYESSADTPWYGAKAYIKTVNISLGVEKIGDKAFYGLSLLEAVSIPESVVSIGDYAFAYCPAVTNISLPDTLATIGDGAFEGCSALTAAFIPADVTSLGNNAFAYCSSITDAAVLMSADIPDGTFLNCTSLERLLLNSGITENMVSDTALKGCEISFEDASFTTSKTAEATVTVTYVDTDGNELAEKKVTKNVAYGDSYSIVSPSIDGYTADKLTVSGYVYGTDEFITVTYTKDEVVDTSEPEEEEDEEITPPTIVAVVVLGVVLVGIAIGAILLMRADKKNASKGQTVRKNTDNNKSKKK